MSQTRFSVTQKSPVKRESLDQKLGELYQNVKNRFEVFGTFQRVLVDFSSYNSEDLKDRQTPEEFAKRIIIEPLIDFLGFETVPETVLPSPTGRKQPDYTIRPKKKDRPIFYMEAESFNIDLLSKDHGVSQVEEWLLSRASKTDYGIATNGLEWRLLKFDIPSAKSREILKVDLRPIFLKKLNPAVLVSREEIEKIEESFLNFDHEYVVSFLSGYLEVVEKEKEEISKRFYNDYVKYVFGYDEEGNTLQGACLLNKIVVPTTLSNNDTRLFSVLFMNRVIFVKFLEERGIVPKNLLRELLQIYKSSSTIGTFYETYLKPLFYEVFNKSKNNRLSTVQANSLYNEIPYLNGGLFREIMSSEKGYNIDNEGVELVLENLLDKYDLRSQLGHKSRYSRLHIRKDY